ncbi:MAG: Crp/Fnr family transcriptional regulator [Elusimicrobia bacterium]|nr:MAG: Crp/Fnr family transcriptional regulator [Elusimicrobiota bacterium]
MKHIETSPNTATAPSVPDLAPPLTTIANRQPPANGTLKTVTARSERLLRERGERIFSAGSSGGAWRVVSGSVRLDRQAPSGEESFASLAISGDIVGAETLLSGKYTFAATALSGCVLVPWPEAAASGAEALLSTLAKAERRAAEVIALRCGQAADRVRRLVMMLAHRPDTGVRDSGAGVQVVLPSRQDMADITALKLETVSRMVSQLRQAGILDPLQRDGHPSLRQFMVRQLATDAPSLSRQR